MTLSQAPQGQMPSTLILKGGGVKGLAFVGAIKTLEEFGFTFETYAGTSAGAITTVLLAAGYDGASLEVEMTRQDFVAFLDQNGRVAQFWRLISKGWMHTGDPLAKWMEELINEKLPNRTSTERIRLDELPRRAIVYASRRSGGEVVFDSLKLRAQYSAALAARYSASIPGFFRPGAYEDEAIYDGGMLNNFPVEIFLRDNPHTPFLALNLVEAKNKGARPWLMQIPLIRLFTDIVNIQLKQREPQILQAYAPSIINISTGDIATTEFRLSKEQKAFLIASGRAATLQYIAKYRPDIELPASVLIDGMEKASTLARVCTANRPASSARKRNGLGALLVVAMTVAALAIAPPAVTRFFLIGPTPQLLKIYPKSAEFQGDLTYYLKNAKDEVFITAVNLFVTLPHQKEVFIEQVQQGLNIKILIFDPTSPQLTEVALTGDVDPQKVRDQCISTLRELKSLQDRLLNGAHGAALQHSGSLEVKVFSSVLHMRTYFVDPRSDTGVVIINPYINTGHFTETPAYLFRDPKSLPYRNYYNSMNLLWKQSKDLAAYAENHADIFANPPAL